MCWFDIGSQLCIPENDLKCSWKICLQGCISEVIVVRTPSLTFLKQFYWFIRGERGRGRETDTPICSFTPQVPAVRGWELGAESRFLRSGATGTQSLESPLLPGSALAGSRTWEAGGRSPAQALWEGSWMGVLTGSLAIELNAPLCFWTLWRRTEMSYVIDEPLYISKSINKGSYFSAFLTDTC